MATNKFKKATKQKSGDSFFSWAEKALKLDQLLGPGAFATYIPHAVFVAFLGVVYIWYNHQSEKMTREINQLELEVEDLRADYTTLDAEYMYARKQSEVAKKVKRLGLEEIDKPLKRITVQEN